MTENNFIFFSSLIRDIQKNLKTFKVRSRNDTDARVLALDGQSFAELRYDAAGLESVIRIKLFWLKMWNCTCAKTKLVQEQVYNLELQSEKKNG